MGVCLTQTYKVHLLQPVSPFQQLGDGLQNLLTRFSDYYKAATAADVDEFDYHHYK